jgi:N-acetylmuramoyl-L-alanine amidase
MGRLKRRIVLGVAAGVTGTLGFFLLLGNHSLHVSPPPPHLPQVKLASVKAEPLAGVIVVIDPGHGGADPGAICGPVSEAALTYRTATETAACLRLLGAEVSYTVHSRQLSPNLALTEPSLERPIDAALALTGRSLRRRHTSLPLWQRAEWAGAIWRQRLKQDRNARWDVFFISLHYDEYQVSGVSGSVVCVDRRVHGLPFFGVALAGEMAQDNERRGCDYRGIAGVSGHELGVLNPAYNPIPEKVLLELATLSNPQDALEAGSAVWRTEMARRITQAILLVHHHKDASRKAALTL